MGMYDEICDYAHLRNVFWCLMHWVTEMVVKEKFNELNVGYSCTFIILIDLCQGMNIFNGLEDIVTI